MAAILDFYKFAEDTKCPPVRILKPYVSLTKSNNQILLRFQCIRGCIGDPVLLML